MNPGWGEGGSPGGYSSSIRFYPEVRNPADFFMPRSVCFFQKTLE
jgi:hypothetical protein